jgi:hypothetical protein
VTDPTLHDDAGRTGPDRDDEPDPQVLWGWVRGAIRPHLGWILVGGGALLMLLGYLGVSREALPAKQIPYLVSGGIGGMFLAVLGAYFLGTQELRKDSGRLDRLERMVEELHLALLRRADAPDLTALRAASANGTNGTTSGRVRRFVVVEGGELFHRPSCDLVEGKDTEEVTPAAARKSELRPCPSCTPVPADATVD